MTHRDYRDCIVAGEKKKGFDDKERIGRHSTWLSIERGPTFAPFMLLRPPDVYIQATSEVMLSMFCNTCLERRDTFFFYVTFNISRIRLILKIGIKFFRVFLFQFFEIYV